MSGDRFVASPKTVSYVSWTDCSADRHSAHSAIRTTAKQNLDTLPWLSDGNPVKGKSVNSLESFKKMVMPAVNRHKDTLLVLYASGIIKAVEVDSDKDTPETLFKRIAPTLRAAGPKVRDRSADEDEEEEDNKAEEDDAPADDQAEPDEEE